MLWKIDKGLKEMINSKLNYLNEHIKDNNEVIITYFIQDKKKNGGKYINKIGVIKRIDSVNEIIKFKDNSIIKMNDVINISSDIFNSIFEKWINLISTKLKICGIIYVSGVVNRFDYILIISLIFLWNYQNEKRLEQRNI